MREEIRNWMIDKLEDLGIETTDFKFEEDMYAQGISSLEYIQLVVFVETEF